MADSPYFPLGRPDLASEPSQGSTKRTPTGRVCDEAIPSLVAIERGGSPSGVAVPQGLRGEMMTVAGRADWVSLRTANTCMEM